MSSHTFLVLGATGRTGRHFINLALKEGHQVKALVRNPGTLSTQSPRLAIIEGSIQTYDKVDDLVHGTDCVIAMLGDARVQRNHNINTQFVQKLIPAMRRQGVKKFLYQAGALTRRYREPLPAVPWLLKNTVARYQGLYGQHRDNEAVISYLVEQASDIEWMVHHAAITSDGPSKGDLERSTTAIGLATFVDCATYNYRALTSELAIHSCDWSHYARQ